MTEQRIREIIREEINAEQQRRVDFLISGLKLPRAEELAERFTKVFAK